MELSGQPSSTSHHTSATSSSVIVQSNQPEDGVSLTSLSDIQQLQHPSLNTASAVIGTHLNVSSFAVQR